MSNKISRRTFLKCTGASDADLGAAAMLGGCGSSTSNAIEVKVGDKVLTSKYSGTEVKVDGEECTIVRQGDILAIVE